MIEEPDAMEPSTISGVIGGAVSLLLIAYISSRVRNSAIDGSLRYGWWLAFLGSCCLAFVALAAGAFFYDDDVWTDRGEFIAVVGLIVGFGLGAILSFGEYFLTSGKFDEQGIEFRTPWTGRKVETWRDLQSIKFSSSMNWYVLTFGNGKKIRLSCLLSGHGAVLEKLKSLGHLPD